MSASVIDRVAALPRATPVVLSRFVCRVSGMPATAALGLAGDEFERFTAELWALEERLDAGREALSAALFAAVGGVGDKKTRNQLVELRRSLFNNRRPTDSQLAATSLDGSLANSVREAAMLLAGRQRLLGDAAAVYEATLAAARQRLREALGDTDFQSALALSSETLFRNLEAYRSASDRLGGSRLEQIERGLVRYFTRMSMKATPFSRFCAVIGGELSSGDDTATPLLRFTATPRKKHSIIRLNKRICAAVASRATRQAAVRDRLRVEANPTLVREQDRFAFLAVVKGRETFQRVSANMVLELVVDRARANPSPTLGDVVTALTADERFETTVDEARMYLDRLLAIGLLRTQAVVAEQEADWLDPLLAFLSPIDDEIARAATQLLRDLAGLLDRYAAGAPPVRAQTLAEIRARLKDGYTTLGLVPPAEQELPLYEDATADARVVVRNSADVRKALEKLTEWARLTLPLAGDRAEMATMRHFFDKFYADRADLGVPLLSFYEDYYREHFKAHLEKSRKASAGKPEKGYVVDNPFNLDTIKMLRHAEGLLHETIRAEWAKNPDATEIVVTRDAIARAIGPMAGDRFREQRSVSFFCQMVSDDAGNACIMLPSGNYGTGYGKFYSRFLYLLPKEWEYDVVHSNNQLSKNLLAEICGDAAFNANLHPPLLPWEVSYPTGQRGGSANQLLGSDLQVRRDPNDTYALVLMTKDSRQVWPIDLGFLTLLRRPPLYQLLARFSPVRHFALTMLPMTHAKAEGRAKGEVRNASIRSRPRITFEGAVMLARRQWLVPQAAFPAQTPGESDADYMLRIARWRRAHDIPRRVFVRVRPIPDPARPQPADAEAAAENQAEAAHESEEIAHVDALEYDEPAASMPESKQEAKQGPAQPTAKPKVIGRQSRDYRKPQFIDFGNPILVQLFSRLPGSLKFFNLTLEECFPNADQLPTADGDAYATEMILQLSFPERGS